MKAYRILRGLPKPSPGLSSMRMLLIVLFLASGLAGSACGTRTPEDKLVLRVGHFPNVTHAQAVIGHALSRRSRGWFEQKLGANATIQWFVYNAGPSAMEGIFAGSLDLTYVGPNPAINAYIKSSGEEIRIVAGACNGGSAVVVQPDGRIKSDADFKGKKVGTPQLGNTQDVAARAWLQSKGLRIQLTGGDALVIPTANPDQLMLFQRGELDAIWTVEPWVSRLVLEAGGKVYFEESMLWGTTGGRYVTTHLVSSVRFLHEQSTLVKRWIAAQIELTDWIRDNANEAKQLFNEEVRVETGQALPQAILDRAWTKLELTHDPVRDSLLKSAADAVRIGLLKGTPDLTLIYEAELGICLAVPYGSRDLHYHHHRLRHRPLVALREGASCDGCRYRHHDRHHPHRVAD